MFVSYYKHVDFNRTKLPYLTNILMRWENITVVVVGPPEFVKGKSMIKFIQSTNRKFFVGVLLTSTLAVSTMLMQQSWLSHSQGLFKLNAGLNTCFTRVTQTFTSIMIQQFQSPYLTREFTDLTSSCFNDVQKQFKAISSSVLAKSMMGGTNLASGKSINSSLNQMLSDTHWFHEKALKIRNMVSDNTIDNTIDNTNEGVFNLTNSNILNKYSGLESVKDLLLEKVQSKRASGEAQAEVMQFIAISFLFLSFGLGVAWFINARKSSLQLIEVETIASNMLLDNNVPSEKVDRLVEMAFSAANLPKALELVQSTKYIHSQAKESFLDFEERTDLERSKELNLNESMSEKNRSDLSVTNLNNAFNAALKGVQNKAFTYGVIIDFDLDDELMVHGEQEDLQQVIYTTINYAIDSSMLHNQGRKIIIRSKALGGTIYLKVSVTNHCFNASELEYLSDPNSVENDVNVNLVMIKELASVNQTQFHVTNKVNSAGELRGSEVEFLFNRAEVVVSSEIDSIEARHADQLDKNKYLASEKGVANTSTEDAVEFEQSQKQLSSIMKGSKKEIMARLHSEKASEV